MVKGVSRALIVKTAHTNSSIMALAHAHLLYHVGAHGLTNQQVKKQDASVRACSYSAMTGVHRDHLVLTSDGQWPRYSIFCLGVKSFLLTLSY